ncbi:MAG: helix-turn-helix domain-containing protein [Streptosporangiales bacterium]
MSEVREPAPTVRDLLASPPLQESVLLGGAAGLDRPVTDVALVGGADELPGTPRGSAVVFDLTGASYRDHLVELLCRQLVAYGGRLLVASGEVAAALSLRRVADRLELPVVGTTACTAPRLTAELLAAVHQPAVLAGRLIVRAARGLPATEGRPDRLVALLESVLSARCALVTREGTVVAGSPPRVAVAPPSRPTTRSELVDGTRVVYGPVRRSDGSPALWLVGERGGAGPAWARTAGEVFDVAAGYVTAWLASERLSAERDDRFRGELLTELLERSEPVPAPVAEQAAAIGWRLDGWHTAVHLAPLSRVPATELSPAVRTALGEALTATGVGGSLVERAGGWVTWLTDEREPPAGSGRATARTLRRGLAAYHGAADVPALVAGVGRAAVGVDGLRASLDDARQAAVLATTSGHAGAVECADELGVKQFLLGWYGSAAARAHAAQLLAPIVGDGGVDLVQTVEAYLDAGRSPTDAAARLGLHRNTVAYRIRQVEGLLGVSFDRPDERLAVHLACRTLRVETPDGPTAESRR